MNPFGLLLWVLAAAIALFIAAIAIAAAILVIRGALTIPLNKKPDAP